MSVSGSGFSPPVQAGGEVHHRYRGVINLDVTLSSATRVRVMGYGVERSNDRYLPLLQPVQKEAFFYCRCDLNVFQRQIINTNATVPQAPSPTARCRLPAFTATPGCS